MIDDYYRVTFYSDDVVIDFEFLDDAFCMIKNMDESYDYMGLDNEGNITRCNSTPHNFVWSLVKYIHPVDFPYKWSQHLLKAIEGGIVPNITVNPIQNTLF